MLLSPSRLPSLVRVWLLLLQLLQLLLLLLLPLQLLQLHPLKLQQLQQPLQQRLPLSNQISHPTKKAGIPLGFQPFLRFFFILLKLLGQLSDRPEFLLIP